MQPFAGRPVDNSRGTEFLARRGGFPFAGKAVYMRAILRSLFSLALCALIVFAGYAGVRAYQKYFPPVEPPPPAETPPVNVKVRVIRPALVEDTLLLTGRIEPLEEATVSAEASGVVEWLGVDVGDTVKKGQEIARIDTSRIQTVYDQAAARKNLAVQELARMRDLAKGGIASPQNLDQLRTQFELAEADLAAAKILLDKSRAHAPFDGVVSHRARRQGEFTDNGAPLLRMVQTHQVKVFVGVPERDINRFSLGDEAALTLDAIPDQTFTGRIHRLPPTAELATRTFVTELLLDNADGMLKPGMTARVRMVRDTYPDAVAVSLFSVLTLENQRFVVVEEGGMAQVRPVTLGVLQGDMVHVLSGLAPGDRLIVSGQRDLREGRRVNVTEVVEE